MAPYLKEWIKNPSSFNEYVQEDWFTCKYRGIALIVQGIISIIVASNHVYENEPVMSLLNKEK